MKNKTFEYGRQLKELLKFKGDIEFHRFFIEYSINQYKSIGGGKNKLGSILVLGANERETEILIKYPFKKIVLSGIVELSEKMKNIIKKDSRMSYVNENIECLSARDKSFDIVYCKESLHHVPRPIIGIYEMLRVCKKAIIFIEPNETFIGNLLDFLSLSSNYEKNQKGNVRHRDNFVYRWRKKDIEKILNSYYLESGYELHLTTCWNSNQQGFRNHRFRDLFIIAMWIMSHFFFSRGNYLNALILPGSNLPSKIKRRSRNENEN